MKKIFYILLTIIILGLIGKFINENNAPIIVEEVAITIPAEDANSVEPSTNDTTEEVIEDVAEVVETNAAANSDEHDTIVKE